MRNFDDEDNSFEDFLYTSYSQCKICGKQIGNDHFMSEHYFVEEDICEACQEQQHTLYILQSEQQEFERDKVSMKLRLIQPVSDNEIQQLNSGLDDSFFSTLEYLETKYYAQRGCTIDGVNGARHNEPGLRYTSRRCGQALGEHHDNQATSDTCRTRRVHL